MPEIPRYDKRKDRRAPQLPVGTCVRAGKIRGINTIVQTRKKTGKFGRHYRIDDPFVSWLRRDQITVVPCQ